MFEDGRKEGSMGPGWHDPEDRRRPPHVAHLLAVASGKGGVGKSTVTVNLALALVARGRRVGILDADVHGPNVPFLLGVRRRAAAPPGALFALAGTVREEERPRPLVRHGLAILSLALFAGEEQHLLAGNLPLAGQVIERLLLASTWGGLDYLLIDLPPGTGEPQATLAGRIALDGVVLVVTPQDLALLDTTRSRQLFREAGVPILGVVENMSHFVCPHCGERVEVFARSAEAWAVRDAAGPLLGEVPLDVAIGQAANAGRPVVVTAPASPPAAAFFAIADAVRHRVEGP